MTTNEEVAHRNISLLELAKVLNNLSKACKFNNYSRQQLYEIRRNYQTYRAEGLLDKYPGSKGTLPNQVVPKIELDPRLLIVPTNPLYVASGAGANLRRYQCQCRRRVWRVATSQLATQAQPLAAPRENPSEADDNN